MKTLVLILGSLAVAAQASPRLPAGMARADDSKAVAALDSQANQKRVEAILSRASDEDRPTAAEEYHLKLIAYREQLVEEQRQRRIQEIELQLEREARARAEEAAARAERQRRRESIYLQHHSVHAYQRNLNDEYWRKQHLIKALKHKKCHTPCPTPTPYPLPAPASSDEESSGALLP